ncbi:TPA: glycosyltransferase [Citrobacter freundii]|uniref:glycosyltransferase n=1 Tax=Enterobacteriaceae TaxID=543 RepID=UPI0023A80F79|nr:glycosyltransferase [Enterobacter hormaechei]HEE9839849.1 glycosyltransferase [Citrobacter freundii]WCS70489.1 Glycosyltransferase involved in cell wall bio [Enterobacter hormaechei]HEE9871435.1 glycosyltransferase [Citrobacter freundii]HEE9891234.1 glycosyltransferase [Citrobacter freundii]HEE9977943.1 glycosyltransferase [Citrobacter freundii]
MKNIYIVTVCRNALYDLKETVNNIAKINANLENRIEHVIIDGDSSDGTKEFLLDIKEAVYYCISEPDKGIYDAMNKGWNVVPEESYVLFIGAGDKITSLPKLENKTVDVIYGSVDLERNKIFKSFINWRTNLSNTLHHQAMLILKKAPFLNSPFNSKYKIYGDYDMNLNMINEGFSFHYAEDFLAYAKPGGISHDFNHKENLNVVFSNKGFFWAVIALIRWGYCSMRRKLKRDF